MWPVRCRGGATFAFPPHVDCDQGFPEGLAPQRVRDDAGHLRSADLGITGVGGENQCRRPGGDLCPPAGGRVDRVCAGRSVCAPDCVLVPPAAQCLQGGIGQQACGHLPIHRVRAILSVHVSSRGLFPDGLPTFEVRQLVSDAIVRSIRRRGWQPTLSAMFSSGRRRCFNGPRVAVARLSNFRAPASCTPSAGPGHSGWRYAA